MSAVVLVVVAAPLLARAEPWRLGVEAGAEIDSNVNRVEAGVDQARGAALARAGVRGDGSGTVLGGRWAVASSLLTRVALDGDVHDEDVAALAGDLRWLRPLVSRPVGVGVRLAGYDVLSLRQVGPRDFRWLLAEGTLAFDDGGWRVNASAGGHAFTYTSNGDLDWFGPTAALSASSALWRGTADDGEASSVLELTASYRGELRRYASLARANVCPPGADPMRSCFPATMEPRRDIDHRLGVGVVFTGERIYSGDYQLTINDSSSHGQSYLRHRLTAAGTTALPARIYATAQVSFQLDQHLDGLVLETDPELRSFTTIEDEDRSSISVRLARAFGPRFGAELRWAYWMHLFASEGLEFRRQLWYLGLTWSAG